MSSKVVYWGFGNSLVNIVFIILILGISIMLLTTPFDSLTTLVTKILMILGFLYVLLVYFSNGVIVDYSKGTVEFIQLFIKRNIDSKQISSWLTYKKPIPLKQRGSLVKYVWVFQCKFKNGQEFSYQGNLVSYFTYNEMRSIFKKVLKKDGRDLGVKNY